MHSAEKNTFLYTIPTKILFASTLQAPFITKSGYISGRYSCAAAPGTSESQRYVRLALVGHLMKTMALSRLQSDSPNLATPSRQFVFKYGTASPHQNAAAEEH